MELTPQQLRELISGAVEAAVKAAKQPSEIEQAQLDKEKEAIKVAQEHRLRLSSQVQEDAAQKKAMQLICNHEHRNGDTHMVYIQEKVGPGYLLCQKNQCKVRPGVAPANNYTNDIYDTELFNRCFQKINVGAEIFG